MFLRLGDDSFLKKVLIKKRRDSFFEGPNKKRGKGRNHVVFGENAFLIKKGEK